MASNTPDDASSQHHSILYCPSCGASASLSIVPSRNAGLFCDICTSTNLLVSTNDGADWNPLSDAFNALTLSPSDQLQHHQHHDPSALPQVIQHPVEHLQIQSPTPTIQDEMKRRSLILSELINFREALYQHHNGPPEDGSCAHTDGEQMQEAEEGSGPNTNTMMEDNMELHQADHISNIARTYNDLLHLRHQSGMFLMDEVDTMDLAGAGGGGSGGDGGGMYMHHNNIYQNGIYPHPTEEEGIYDDPPQEYVNAHPPVQESDQMWYGSHPTVPQAQVKNDNNKEEELLPHPQPLENTNNSVLKEGDDGDEDDEEGQVYATPEQREEMKRRRSELHQDKELKAREMFWRKYGIGSLGAGN
ncbi:hypothetical protein TWF102_011523 [Orbilia oligospora]|uniref:Uncharacterized protein n=1 Tax=Orbilia oligospora TaxID=2813651 RepID=A0A7C8JBE6_ORBOL|nr:hypothetical protein TWF706_007498 [Orbilia oligospora]KAF3105754.1 hypothetical protein TWF103_006457 [Orbilia oligospora]KAF3108042.1 hypothetical protein TWF102_011523 [Orbilia oligospora]